MNSTVQLRKLKLREADRLVQVHPALNPASWTLFVQNPDQMPLPGSPTLLTWGMGKLAILQVFLAFL